MTNDDVMLSTAQVCELLGNVTSMTLWRWKRDRGFPAGVKIGSQRFHWKSDVIDWIAAQSEEAA